MNWNIAVILVLGSVSCSIPGLLAQYRPYYSGYGRSWNSFGGGYGAAGYNSRFRPGAYQSYVPGALGGYFYNRGFQGASTTAFNGFNGFNTASSKQAKDDILWRLKEQMAAAAAGQQLAVAQPNIFTKSTTKGPNAGQPNILQPSAGLLSTAMTPADTTRIVTEPTPFRQPAFNNFFTQPQLSFTDIETNSLDIDPLPKKTTPVLSQASVSAAPPQITAAPTAAQFDPAINAIFSNDSPQSFPQFEDVNLRDIELPPPAQFQNGLTIQPQPDNEIIPVNPDFLEFLKPVPAVPGLPFQSQIDFSSMSKEEMEKVMRFLQFQPFILDPVPAVPDQSSS